MTQSSDPTNTSDLFSARTVRMPVGVVVTKSPGVTRWAKEIWKPTALIPGAKPADWVELRREGQVIEYHARTVEIELFRTEVEAYRAALSMTPPSAFVVLDEDPDDQAPGGWIVTDVTLSAYLAQDVLDSGFSLVESVALPPVIAGWAKEFVDHHYIDEPFKKRQRDRLDVEQVEDGIGDPRVRQMADVYRAPGSLKKGTKH